jgi:hypothetical protein
VQQHRRTAVFLRRGEVGLQQRLGESPPARFGKHADDADVSAVLLLDELLRADQQAGRLPIDVADPERRPVGPVRVELLAELLEAPGDVAVVLGERLLVDVESEPQVVVLGVGPAYDDSGARLGRRFAAGQVDAHPREGGGHGEAAVGEPAAGALVLAVGGRVEEGVVVAGRCRELEAARLQDGEDLAAECAVVLGMHIDVELDLAGLLGATHPAVADQSAGLVVPAGVLEVGAAQVSLELGEGVVGPAEHGGVTRQQERADRGGVVEGHPAGGHEGRGCQVARAGSTANRRG